MFCRIISQKPKTNAYNLNQNQVKEDGVKGMLFIVYLVFLVVAPLLRLVSYKLGRDVIESNFKIKLRLVMVLSLLPVIVFMFFIPLVNDGSVLMLFVNIVNMLLAGLIGYTFIQSFKRGIREEKFKKKFMEDIK